jgi:hypothetical protein
MWWLTKCKDSVPVTFSRLVPSLSNTLFTNNCILHAIQSAYTHTRRTRIVPALRSTNVQSATQCSASPNLLWDLKFSGRRLWKLVLWNVTPCSLVKVQWRLRGNTRTFLWNVGILSCKVTPPVAQVKLSRGGHEGVWEWRHSSTHS